MHASPLRGEDAILAILDEYFPRNGGALLLGRGDDCAVMRAEGPLAVTCDIFAEDAHFRSRYFSPADIGYKALAVNISDLAAQGAWPEAFVMGLTLRGDEDEAWLRGFASGMASLADQYGMMLAGGDLARSPVRHVSITAWGTLEGPPLCRGKAREGDTLFVVGPLGLAHAGLLALESSSGPDDIARVTHQWPDAVAVHLRPRPRVEESYWLAHFQEWRDMENRLSLMDVSDGLARDLPRLLGGTGLGAELSLPEAVLHDEVPRFAALHGLDPAVFAYEGGEDYALLGSCPSADWPALAAALGPEAYSIGTARPGPTRLNGVVPDITGFDHFS